MGYCHCTAIVVYGGGGSTPPSDCDGCLVAKKLAVGCGQGLVACGSSTDIDVDAKNNNPDSAVYSVTSYDTNAFDSVTMSPEGILSVSTAEIAYESGKTYRVNYKVVNGKYSNFGWVDFCFDNPCDDGCAGKCEPCSGTCWPEIGPFDEEMTCNEADHVVDIYAGLTFGDYCTGGNDSVVITEIPDEFSWTYEDFDSTEGSPQILLTSDATVVPNKTYVIKGTLSCDNTGITRDFSINVTITDLCEGVSCGPGQECDKCTGLCVDLESDLLVDKSGFAAGDGGGSGFV